MKLALCLVEVILLSRIATCFIGILSYSWFKKCVFSKTRAIDCPEPYYFGTTDLFCMMKYGKKGKRDAPDRWIHELTHRFIYYRGYYFEFGSNYSLSERYARESYRCRSRRESEAAGYSSVSVECLKNCTRYYTWKFGKYNLFTNNCHVFANKMSEILYKYSYGSCPYWC